MRQVVRRRSGKNSVIVGGVALRFGERLISAARAAGEVAMMRGPPVQLLDDGLRFDRHLVDAAMRPVSHDADVEFALRYGPCTIVPVALMARVGTADCVPLVQSLSHPPVRQGPPEGAETEPLEAAVPVLERHPDFEMNRGCHDSRDPAEGAMYLDRRLESQAFLSARDGVPGARMNRFRAGDSRLR